MDYLNIVHQINSDKHFRDVIKKYVSYESDDFELTQANSESSIGDTLNSIAIKFIGGYQVYLITLEITFENENQDAIKDLTPSGFEDIAGEKVKADKLNFDIDYWSYNITYDQLSRMKEEGKILVPDMQRGFVWDKVQASKLIESIFIGLPLPSLFLIKQDDGKYLIVDGLQRITSIHCFKYNLSLPNMSKKTNGFSLTGVNENLLNATYQSIKREQPTLIDRFDMGTINVIEFKQNKPEYEEAMYSLFERLNSGGTNLTAQQIRNSIYYGLFNDKLNSFSKKMNKYFSQRAIMGLAPSELILRSISIYNYINDNNLMNKESKDVSGTVVYKNMLNKTAEKYHIPYKKIERLQDETKKSREREEYSSKIERLFSSLYTAIINIERFFGNNAFKRYDNGKFKSRISPILFEALVTTELLYPDKKFTDKSSMIENYKSIFNENDEYEKYFTQATGSVKNIKNRVATMKRVLFND